MLTKGSHWQPFGKSPTLPRLADLLRHTHSSSNFWHFELSQITFFCPCFLLSVAFSECHSKIVPVLFDGWLNAYITFPQFKLRAQANMCPRFVLFKQQNCHEILVCCKTETRYKTGENTATLYFSVPPLNMHSYAPSPGQGWLLPSSANQSMKMPQTLLLPQVFSASPAVRCPALIMKE